MFTFTAQHDTQLKDKMVTNYIVFLFPCFNDFFAPKDIAEHGDGRSCPVAGLVQSECFGLARVWRQLDQHLTETKDYSRSRVL
jgi:hypothetical protein